MIKGEDKTLNKLFCLVAKSGAGKDSILEILQKEYGFKKAISYTTRPMREGEVDGVTYHFVTDDEMQKLIKNGSVIEHHSFNTDKGIWIYGTHIDIKNDLKTSSLICIKEPYGVKALINELGYKNVIPIYIDVDDETRLKRSIKRESKQEKPNYNELCRRFLDDQKDFNYILQEDIFKVKNYNIYDAVKEVYEYIKGYSFKYYQCEDNLKIRDTIKVIDIRNKDTGRHLVSKIGKVGKVSSYIIVGDEKRYRVMFENKETHYFRRSELEKVVE